MTKSAKAMLGYAICALLAFGSMILVSVLPFTIRPTPNRMAGVLFGPAIDAPRAAALIALADPRARLVDIRWGGKLVFLRYEDVNFPEALRRAGALYMFDAIAAGCHAGKSRAAGS